MEWSFHLKCANYWNNFKQFSENKLSCIWSWNLERFLNFSIHGSNAVLSSSWFSFLKMYNASVGNKQTNKKIMKDHWGKKIWQRNQRLLCKWLIHASPSTFLPYNHITWAKRGGLCLWSNNSTSPPIYTTLWILFPYKIFFIRAPRWLNW